jgi:hypothetical protein
MHASNTLHTIILVSYSLTSWEPITPKAALKQDLRVPL